MANPFPDLAIYPLSGLSFPWAFYHPETLGNFGASLGPDGVSTSEVMVINWDDLETACTELLGYSWRDTSSATPDGGSWLRRKLPWQHPYFNQLWLKRISDVKAGPLAGTSITNPFDFFVSGRGVGGFVGAGVPQNFGPWTQFKKAFLTLQFWRPPYYVRSDADIVGDDDNPQEWLRYVDKHWEQSAQMLVREGCQYHWGPSQGINESPGPPGSIGTPVVHQKLTKRWYQVPEACLFESLVDDTLNGDAPNQMYMFSAAQNPISGLTVVPGGVGDSDYRAYPIVGCVNSPYGGGVDDSTASNRFFGCLMGTLRLDGVEYIPRELQLPPYLMQIPFFAGNEAISQQQYDVVFHFDRFDPPRSKTTAQSVATLVASGALVRQAYRGHNLVPRAGDGAWYGIVSQNNIVGTANKGTPFNYAVFQDLFRVL